MLEKPSQRGASSFASLDATLRKDMVCHCVADSQISAVFLGGHLSCRELKRPRNLVLWSWKHDQDAMIRAIPCLQAGALSWTHESGTSESAHVRMRWLSRYWSPPTSEHRPNAAISTLKQPGFAFVRGTTRSLQPEAPGFLSRYECVCVIRYDPSRVMLRRPVGRCCAGEYETIDGSWQGSVAV